MKNTRRQVFGIGVELGAHVHQGRLVIPGFAGGSFPLGEKLSKALSGRLSGKPVVVENDVNACAAMQIWRKDGESMKLRFPQPHFAVVAVFEETVSGAIVIDRKVYRGSHGMAGEIGHLTVDYARPRRPSSSGRSSAGPDAKGFDDPCLCVPGAGIGAGAEGGRYGHVNALATPVRIAGELGIESSQVQQAARAPGTDQDGHVTREGAVFRTAGEALGRGIAAMLNIANPGNLLLLLPPELAQPAEGTAPGGRRCRSSRWTSMTSAKPGLRASASSTRSSPMHAASAPNRSPGRRNRLCSRQAGVPDSATDQARIALPEPAR
jgi:predicted NBD/HSP70 family sugar kinase